VLPQIPKDQLGPSYGPGRLRFAAQDVHPAHAQADLNKVGTGQPKTRMTHTLSPIGVPMSKEN